MNTSISHYDLYHAAHNAGAQAARALTPEPMVVVDGQRKYFVADGVCGFAWVNVKPGNGAFARWLKAQGYARRDSYYGGVTIWAGDYGQSMQLKSAYAYAFAKVLRDAGIKAYASSRMD